MNEKEIEEFGRLLMELKKINDVHLLHLRITRFWQIKKRRDLRMKLKWGNSISKKMEKYIATMKQNLKELVEINNGNA